MLLENERLLVMVSTLGAEVTRIYDKRRQSELLWDGDPKYWKRRSPVLFPNVGKTWRNQVRIDGETYPTSQHGFARDMQFECVQSTDNVLTLRLMANDETLERFPHPFELTIEYRLEENALGVEWRVRNVGDKEMNFTIGGHPAFRLSQPEGQTALLGSADRKQGFRLLFPGKDRLSYALIDPSTGCCNAQREYALTLEGGWLALSDKLFAHDALIFDNGQIGEVWLYGADGEPCVGMRCSGFPNFGVWSVKDAPFVCLEPWMGRCDDNGFEGELSEKPWINRIAPGEVFQKRYDIVVSE